MARRERRSLNGSSSKKNITYGGETNRGSFCLGTKERVSVYFVITISYHCLSEILLGDKSLKIKVKIRR